ncbi:MAG: metal ABC transporter permease, partial [Bacteroidota bacterium]
SVFLFYRYLFATTFQPVIAKTMGISVQTIHYFLMLMLAFAVVASLRTVGVILVVAMLITPASTALLLSKRLERVLVIAAIVGLLSAIIGLLFAIIFETTPGPAMAVVATAIYLLAVLFAPEKGLIFRYFRRRKLQERIRSEDLLKRAYRLEQEGQLSFDHLEGQLDYSARLMKRHLKQLRKRGLFEEHTLALTQKGKKAAKRLVRAHRLWETYLVQQIGLTEHQIHEDAEKYEHLLSEEILDEVDQKLGYPSTDPHGSPIPPKYRFFLNQLTVGQQAIITHEQVNAKVVKQLWDLGLIPDTSLKVKHSNGSQLDILQEDRSIEVPHHLAELVRVELI